jgi:hypothetical protein
MAKKKASRAGTASVKSQHADSKGMNANRDGKRGMGQAAITATNSQGTSGFRKRQKGGD